MVLPTLNAHATRPKILLNFAKFHWISPFCMVRSRKKQWSVSIFCCTLQCNRGTETIYQGLSTKGHEKGPSLSISRGSPVAAAVLARSHPLV